MMLTIDLRLVPTVRMIRGIPPVLRMRLWRAQGQPFLYLYSYSNIYGRV
jgi:hypothetical protein